MKTGGIILIVFGAIFALLGLLANDTPIIKLLSFLVGGGENPGTAFIILGIILIIAGIVLVVLANKKKKAQ